jgi:hypothetical protein
MKKLNEIQQQLKAKKGQYNRFGKYNYRSCEDILEAVKPLLGDAKLTLSDEIVVKGTSSKVLHRTIEKDGTIHEEEREVGLRFYVESTVTLKHGDETESSKSEAREPFSKKGMDEAQITGATSSYARKYALNGLFCIDDAKDADSTNKHGKEEKPKEGIMTKLVKETGLSEDKARAELKSLGVPDMASLKTIAATGMDTMEKMRTAGKDKITAILKESN